MIHELKQNTAVDASALRLTESSINHDDVVEGEPALRNLRLLDSSSVELGVWEMTPGVITDVEVNEAFIVLSGSAVVEFDNDDAAMHLGAGWIGRLQAGAKTQWTVTKTLRKVYITLPEALRELQAD